MLITDELDAPPGRPYNWSEDAVVYVYCHDYALQYDLGNFQGQHIEKGFYQSSAIY
jgi:hypothetical protein